MATISKDLANQIREHAVRSRSAQRQHKTNLQLDERVYAAGESIGPPFQKAIVSRPSVLVFADDDPLANFGHACRYVLYDAQTGAFDREIAARFPPFLQKPPPTLKTFYQGTTIESPPRRFPVPPIRRCPIIVPDGNRYAVLYSGMSNNRHLNDLEFCYRVLVDRYAFAPDNIYVLNYDGSLNTQEGPTATWPGDGTPYRIQVTGQGNRAAFQSVLTTLQSRLQSDDLLFLHTNNHGDNDSGGSFLCEYPNWGKYYATDFCTDLKGLPTYRSLLVMMEQCNSGGFNVPVIESSTATKTSVASAAIATQSSYASPDLLWDSFARDWISAQMGSDPYGAALAHNPDTDGNGTIEAEEAFSYALSVQNPLDTPNYAESGEPGGDITLDQQYELLWWWCLLLHPVLEKEFPRGVQSSEQRAAFDARLNRAGAELKRLLVPNLDRAAQGLRREVGPKVEAIVRAAFK